MRCPDCNKFVPYDDPHEVETENELELDNHEITGSLRLVLKCAECGTELKDASVDISQSVEIDDKHKDHELTLDADEPEAATKTEGKGRGTKTFYGATVQCRVTCSCGEVIEDGLEISVYEQASFFNELT